MHVINITVCNSYILNLLKQKYAFYYEILLWKIFGSVRKYDSFKKLYGRIGF